MKKDKFLEYIELETLFENGKVTFKEFLCEYKNITGNTEIKKIPPWRSVDWKNRRSYLLKKSCIICGSKERLTIQHTFQPPSFEMCKKLVTDGRIKIKQPKRVFWRNKYTGNVMGLKGSKKKHNLGLCDLIFENRWESISYDKSEERINEIAYNLNRNVKHLTKKSLGEFCPKCNQALVPHWKEENNGLWKCKNRQRSRWKRAPFCNHEFENPKRKLMTTKEKVRLDENEVLKLAKKSFLEEIKGDIDQLALKLWIKYQKDYRELKKGTFITACGDCAYKQDVDYIPQKPKSKDPSPLEKRILARRINEKR